MSSLNDELRLEWAGWLESFSWDYFITVTFREPLPKHRAETVLRSCGKTLYKRLRPERLFLGAEPHISTYMHLHGLYKAAHGTDTWASMQHNTEAPSDVWRPLFETFGRSKVERIRSPEDTAKYVSKYCVKACETYELYTADDFPPAVSSEGFNMEMGLSVPKGTWEVASERELVVPCPVESDSGGVQGEFDMNVPRIGVHCGYD